MSKPIRVQLSRRKGWRMPPNTASVARPTKWGNPFKVDPENGFNRAGAVNAFRILVSSFDEPTWQTDIHELRGKNLACWCPLGQPCHADVLLELANQDTPQ